MADVKCFVNGRIKYLPEHLLKDADFCKENKVTMAAEPVKIEPFVPKEKSEAVFDDSLDQTNDSIDAMASESPNPMTEAAREVDATYVEPVATPAPKKKPGRKPNKK